MKTTVLTFVLFAAILIGVYAQPGTDYHLLPSPDAYGLGKYYDMPVDKSSGLPNISVPLSVVKTGPLSLPIALSYHSSGLRVGEASSSVGLGWTLRGVPTISRSVQMIADDNASLNANLDNSGYLSIASDLSQSVYQDAGYFQELFVDDFPLDDILIYGDNEPDVYTCTLLSGKTFRFTIDINGEPATIPRSNIDISFSSATGVIEVVDEEGVRYTFDVFERRESNPGSDVILTISTWYPSTITTFDGAYSISFTYEDNTLQYASKSSLSATQINTVSAAPPMIFCTTDFYGSLPICSQNNCVFNYPVSYQKYESKNIASISSSDNTSKITFVNDFERDDAFGDWLFANAPKPKTFSKIQVWDQNIVKEEIEFNRSYFLANTAMGSPAATSHVEEAAMRRLKLESLTFKDVQSGKEKQYSFDYYGGNIPHTASPDFDYWGFFNDAGNAGQSVGQNGLPINSNHPLDYFESQVVSTSFGDITFTNPNISKSSSLAGTRSTVLKSITYPTGGKTEFEYELNEFEAIERSFSQGGTYSMTAKHCNIYSCNCYNFSGNYTGSALVPIESFYELYNSTLAFDLESNLTYYTQPGTCTQSPSFTLSIYKPLGGGLYESVTTNFSGNQVLADVRLGEFLGIGIEDENSFVAGDYFFTLESTNADVTVDIHSFDMTESSSVVTGPGLRISKIEQITNDGSMNSSRTYDYDKTNGTTSGILFSSPKKNYFHRLVIATPNNPLSIREETTLYSESYIPLSNFEKGIGFYKRVEETLLSGASVVSEYEWDYDGYRDFSNGYPVGITFNSSLLNKANKKNEQRHADQSITQESSLEHELNDTELIPGLRFVRRNLKYPNINFNAGTCVSYHPVFYRYPLITSNVRLKSKTTTLDGITVASNFSYRPDNAHLLPISEEITHPDGTVEVLETDYAADANNTLLQYYNLIHIPLEQRRYINMNLVSGQRTDYDSFSGYPRPSNIKTYNWQIGQWDTEVSYLNYDGFGNPSMIQKRGYGLEYYSWDYDRLLSRNYQNFNWQYEYYPNSKLLERYTEPNGLQITYTYNGFRQLTEINKYNGKSITSIDYDFRQTDGENKVTTSVTHADGANFTTEQLFDGLGRKIEERKVGYGHNNQDVIYKTEYDNLGRLWKEYEPGFGNTPGAATVYSYEPSPLNRVSNIDYPAPVGASTFTYGSENGLWTKTETNSKGQINKSYTDTRGRQVKTIQGKTPELAETNYHYDDHDNILHVVPPGRTVNDVNYIYSYTYDGRNNILSSKVPEKALVHMRYNSRDDITHYQDGIQPIVHTKYDVFGRVTQTGFVSSLSDNSISSGDLLTEFSYVTTYGDPGFGQAYREKAALLDPHTGSPTATFMQQEVKAWDSYQRPILTEGNHPLAPGDYDAYKESTVLNDLDQAKQTTTELLVGGNNWVKTSDYYYDNGGRLYREQLSFGGQQKELFNITQFDAWGHPVTKGLGGGLQTIDYKYFDNGFLQDINTISVSGISVKSNSIPNINSNSDLFSIRLSYDNIGNIQSCLFTNRGFGIEVHSYTYDGLNRLTSSSSSTSAYHNVYTYKDLLGNIGALSRTGLEPGVPLWTNATIDDLAYSYQNPKSSRLLSIQDASNNEAGFKPTALNYVYDNNGNITFEPQQQLSMSYNHLNLPSVMQWPNNKRLETRYDANGQKWQQVKYDIDQNTQTRTYIAGMEFIGSTLELVAHSEGFIQNIAKAPQDRLVLSGNATQDESAHHITSFQKVKSNQDITYTASGEVLMQEGFQTKSGADFLATISPVSNVPVFQWRYTLRDHLGNTRALFTDKNNDGLIRQSADENFNEVLAFYKYSPFGLEQSGSHQNGGQSNNRYRYNGKELESATGFYEYGARWYDPAIGRFTGVDPLAEERSWMTPYNYVQNNPILRIDPDGTLDSPIFGRDGKFLGTDSKGFEGDIAIMDEDKYNLLTKNGEQTLDHDQVMKWTEFSPHAQTLDNYIANDFDLNTPEDGAFLSNVFTNLLGAANDAGIIDIDMSSLSGGKIWVVPGQFPSSLETNKMVTIANSVHTSGKMYIAAHVHSASRSEYKSGSMRGTQSVWYMGNSGNAINILGVHEPLHGQSGFRGNDAATHVGIYKQILRSSQYRKSLQLTTPEYRSSLQKFIDEHGKK